LTIDTTKIFNINCEADFKMAALEVFRYQYDCNSVYRSWVNSLQINIREVKEIVQIPFLPIEFFKSNKVVCGSTDNVDEIFTSSSTTSQIPSQHFVTDVSVYKTSFLQCFEKFFGKPEEFCVLALLPGYLDRKGSSLVYMCNDLINLSNNPKSGFYLRNLDELVEVIAQLKVQKQRTIIIGVSYALLDLAEKKVSLTEDFTIIETGGMKGTRREMLKEELHDVLGLAFQLKSIASEYGMTELLSQAYALTSGLFSYPAWMRFLVRDVNDPLTYLPVNKTGGLNIIDLANVNSCSFIATKDLGFLTSDGNLRLMGRYDNSDIRGCNLMIG
jgi:phenylacetate-coenzyme A ligase PaaK-like adenylate-forming protein